MTKERHQLWIVMMRRFIDKTSHHELKLSDPGVIDFIETLAWFQDWTMLAILWSLNGNSDRASLMRIGDYLISQKYPDEYKWNIESILNATRCVVTSFAPDWWQEKQRECFHALQAKKEQLVNLCKTLLEEQEKLPLYSGSAIVSLLGRFAPQLKGVPAKEKFVMDLRGLIKYLSDYIYDVMSAIFRLNECVFVYRYELITAGDEQYLAVINKFFNIPPDQKAKTCEMSQYVEDALQRFAATNLEPPQNKLAPALCS